MEMNRFEGRGYDDEEESGTADKEKSKKQPPPDDKEGRYHSLRLVEPGHHDLLNLQQQQAQGVLGELMKRPSEPEKPEDDDGEDDEEEEDKRSSQTTEEPESVDEQETEIAQPEAPAVAQTETEEIAPEQESEREEPEKPSGTSVPAPADESLAETGREPDWLRQDREKFRRAMEYEYGEEESFKEAALSKGNDEPGEPPAAELTTNPNVSLEPEPTHSVEGFQPQGAGQQYEGYVPGPTQPAESTRQSFSEQVDQFTQEFTESAQAGRENAPAPEDVIRPPSREDTSDLSRRMERLSLRQREAASWLVFAAVLGYFANRRRKREIRQQEKDLNQAKKEQAKDVQSLAAGQQAMQDRLARQQEQMARSMQPEARPEESKSASSTEQSMPRSAHPTPERPLASKEQEHQHESDAEAARRAVEEAMAEPEKPEDHKRVEQDAWLRHVIDDRTGREVAGAVRHGHEYEEERSRETFAGRPSFDRTKHSGAGTPVFTGAVQQSGQPEPVYDDHTLTSGEAEPGHSLPPGMQSEADLNHRLPEEEKRNPVVEALTSPWLFLLLSLLLLAYFIATLF